MNVLGVSEPKIQVEDKNRIRVQLAGKKTNHKRVRYYLRELTIRDADDNIKLTGKDIQQGSANKNLNKTRISQRLHLN